MEHRLIKEIHRDITYIYDIDSKFSCVTNMPTKLKLSDQEDGISAWFILHGSLNVDYCTYQIYGQIANITEYLRLVN